MANSGTNAVNVWLSWPRYRLFPYERELAAREVLSLMDAVLAPDNRGEVVCTTKRPSNCERLTYFHSYRMGKEPAKPTCQAAIEASVSNQNGTGKRQQTRYLVHGLHEYKGKFNPQVAHALLNVLGLRPGKFVLDPFCGSGTTLVEAALAGVNGVGFDLNPLAVFLTNAKLRALAVDQGQLRKDLNKICAVTPLKPPTKRTDTSGRLDYLGRWFQPQTLEEVEGLRDAIRRKSPRHAEIFLAVASNLLRDYSLQEPADLRIRRRRTPFPSVGFREAFFASSGRLIDNLEQGLRVAGPQLGSSEALLADVSLGRSLTVPGRDFHRFDGAITSPPYATALPYIDTQRLSLVWLGLIEPPALPALQASLIGSREFHGRSEGAWPSRLASNSDGLPADLADLCTRLQRALVPSDGFRRRAVPCLVYRYFVGMRNSFRCVAQLLKRRARYALVVGHNHTTLGGKRFDLATPTYLARLAEVAGFRVEEILPLQTYQRFGLHQKNAVANEDLLILNGE